MEVDGVSECPSWLKEMLQQPAEPVANVLEAEIAANPSAKAALEYVRTLLEKKQYNELLDAVAYGMQLDDSVDTSSTPQLSVLSAAMGSPPPPLSLQRKLSLFRSLASAHHIHLDPLRLLKLCAGLLADIHAEGGLLFLERLQEETLAAQQSSMQQTPFLQTDKQAGKGLFSVGAVVFLHALKSYLLAKTQQLTKAQEELDEAKKQKEQIGAPDPVLHSLVHRAQAQIDKARKKYGDFCRETLFFLAYTSANAIKEKERYAIARDIAFAALVAPEVFNFGELLQQAIVREAWEQQTADSFLFELLKVVAEGNMDKFNKTFKQYQTQIQQSDLAPYITAIQKKAAATALLRLAFTSSTAGAAVRSSSNNGSSNSNDNGNDNNNDNSNSNSNTKLIGSRALSFAAISEACQVPPDEVERIILSAMAQQLIKGKINQVEQTLSLEWVKPVLLTDAESIQALQTRLCRWASSAEELQQALQHLTAELLRA